MKADCFEDLKIWQHARQLVSEVYYLTDKHQKLHHDYGFKSQITRAAISVMHNIAEGFEREGDIEFARFLSIAKASSGEVRSMLYAAEDLLYVPPLKAQSLRKEFEELSRAIATLASYLKK
jgi:four helix bundle protein